MAEHKPKKGVELLINNEAYRVKKEVSLAGIWDIIIEESRGLGRSDTYTKVLASKVLGSEEAVTRLAQEAFGCRTDGAYSSKYDWKIVPSKMTVEIVVDVEKLLNDLEIEARPISDDLPQKEKKKK